MSITRTSNPADFGAQVAQKILVGIPPEFPHLYQLLADRILTVGEKIQADASLNTEDEVNDLISQLRNASDKAILLSLMDSLGLDTDKLDDQHGENLYDRIYKSSPPALKIQLKDNREDVIGKIKDYTLAQVADLAANVIRAVETDSRKLGIAMGELGLSTDIDDVNKFFGTYQYDRIISKDPFLQPYLDPALVVPALGANEDLKGNKEVDDLVTAVKNAITNKKEDLAGELAKLGIIDPAVAVKLFGDTQYDRLSIPPYLQPYVDRDAVSAALGRDPNVHGDADVNLALAKIKGAAENELLDLADALRDFGIDPTQAPEIFGDFHIQRILADNPVLLTHPLVAKHLTDNHDDVRDALGNNPNLHNNTDVDDLVTVLTDALSQDFSAVSAALQALGLDPADDAKIFAEYQYERILHDHPSLATEFTARESFVIDTIAISNANDDKDIDDLIKLISDAVAADDVMALKAAMHDVGLDDTDDTKVENIYRKLKFKEIIDDCAHKPQLQAALKAKETEVMQNIDPNKPTLIWDLLDAVANAKSQKDAIQALVNLDLDPAKAGDILNENRQARHNVFAPGGKFEDVRQRVDVKFRDEFLTQFVLTGKSKEDRFKRINNFLKLMWQKAHEAEKSPNPDLKFLSEKEKKCDDIKYDLVRYKQLLENIKEDIARGGIPRTAHQDYIDLYIGIQDKYGSNFAAKINEAIKEVNGYIDMANTVIQKIQPVLASGYKATDFAYSSGFLDDEKAIYDSGVPKDAIAAAKAFLSSTTSTSTPVTATPPSITGILAGAKPLDDINLEAAKTHAIAVPVTIKPQQIGATAGATPPEVKTVSVREYNPATKSAKVSMYGDFHAAELKNEKPIFKGGPGMGTCEWAAKNIQMLLKVGLSAGDKVEINPGKPRISDKEIASHLLYCDYKGLIPDTSHPKVREIAKQLSSSNKKAFAEEWKKDHPEDLPFTKEQKIEAKSAPLSDLPKFTR